MSFKKKKEEKKYYIKEENGIIIKVYESMKDIEKRANPCGFGVSSRESKLDRFYKVEKI